MFFTAPDLLLYSLSPRPSSDPQSREDDTLGSCAFNGADSAYECFGSAQKLTDGVLGSVGSYNSTIVHAWSRAAGRIVVSYLYGALNEGSLRHFNLFFYNIPSMRIGLPNIEILTGSMSTPHPYRITGNGDITPDDNGLRSVTLSVVSPNPSRTLRLVFTFEDTNIDWLVLSEIIMCPQPRAGMCVFVCVLCVHVCMCVCLCLYTHT